MKLTIKRNQADVKGLFGGHKGVRFSLYAKANITSEEQFLYLSKYIHRNPIEILPIGINLEGYQYSSYGNYLRVFYQSWVEPEEILSYFSRRKYDNSYKEFVDEFEERDAFKVKDIVIEDDLQG